MFKYAVILAVVLPGIFAFYPCRDYPTLFPDAVRSDKCSGSLCHLDSDVNIDFEIDFTAPNEITSFSPAGYLIFDYETVLDQPIEFPTDLSIGCNHVSGGCPILAGQTRTWSIDWDWYREHMTADQRYTVEAWLRDQNEQVFACIQFDIQYVHA